MEERPMKKARRVRPTPIPVQRALRELGESVATWRKLRGLTQKQLAERAGVGRATVHKLEKGEGALSLENSLRVFRALGVLDQIPQAVDPFQTELGRLRSGERLPQRVRPRDFGTDDGR